ncbi:MAG TPA: serine hydrolase domain-containing protein [Hyphomicrobiaceae bacterium]|jgi:CubicO group peptidase (beta-lactamase class C family)
MRTHLLSLAVVLSSAPSFAMSDGELRAALERRFKDDRTGACVAAAVIDKGMTASAYVCAKSQRPFDEHTAFEIGSNSKPMIAALLAEFIARGEITLDDPIAKLLPAGTSVPSFNGREITVRDIVTHTSGLPSFPWRVTEMNNPFAGLTERDLLDALAATKLTRAPGSQWEYSNFATMVLSYALAKRSGKDFETLLRERLLVPLGMSDTYVAKRPPRVRLAQGHLPNGSPAVPWDFPADMAGVGGVRATLPDMVRYLEGQLGTRESAITPVLVRTQQEVARVSGHTMGLNWEILSTPTIANGRTIVMHGGGTGGYTSFVAFDRAAKRAVVLLSDTALGSFGGLSQLALHLLDLAQPAGAPRIAAIADAKLIEALAGRYRLLPIGLGIDLRREGNALITQADAQPEFEMGYDSAGDFYPLAFEAVLRPKRKADGTYTFTWFQGGGAFEATRITPAPAVDKWFPTEAQLKDYDGNYLATGFALRVFSAGTKLFIDAANHGALELAAMENDTFVAEAIGAEIGFERDATGKVTALALRQHGQVLRGERR